MSTMPIRARRAVRCVRACAVAPAIALGVAALLIAPFTAAAEQPTEEDLAPNEWPRDVVEEPGACDNYRCQCGDACACGAGCGCGSSTASMTVEDRSSFDSGAVVLRARVSLQQFGEEFSAGNDCWGYVSPSGREYALMGLTSALAVVDITDPANPVLLGDIDHTPSVWADVKTYDQYAYVVNESGGGVQVVDLTDVDAGQISLAAAVDLGGGVDTSHNIAIDEASGFAYLCGSNTFNGGLVALDLSDPTNPTFAGAYTDLYVHDAEIVTFDQGPHAGRQIAFCFVGPLGLDIVDVTDKANMVRLSRIAYPNMVYSHQGWLDKNAGVLYLNDELDESNGVVATTTTRVFDVSNLSAPSLLGTFTSGLPVIDHNLYAHEGFIYQANYRSGLRIFDAASDPVSPTQVGFFDTFDGADEPLYDGAWSVFPFFPSGSVIVSDIQGGLFVLDPAFALAGGVPVDIELLDATPESVAPTGQTLSVRITPDQGVTLSGAPALLVDDGASTTRTDLAFNADAGAYVASFPTLSCAQNIRYWIEAQTTAGLAVNEPLSAPVEALEAFVASGVVPTFTDTFDADQGWSVGATNDTATSGLWVRADPVGTAAQPENDADDAGALCFITGNASPGLSEGVNDVDGGQTTLISPTLDATGDGVAFLEYQRWFSNDRGANPGTDTLEISISNDNAQTWTTIESVSENANAWVARRFRIDQLLAPTSQMRLRFVAGDLGGGSIVEAGVDDVRITRVECASGPADFNLDGVVNAVDLSALLSAWGPCAPNAPCPVDVTGDNTVNAADLSVLLSGWGN